MCHVTCLQAVSTILTFRYVVWITNDRKLKSITKIKSVVKQKRLFSNCAAWGLMQPDELKTGIYVLAIFSDERNARRILQSMVEILCS